MKTLSREELVAWLVDKKPPVRLLCTQMNEHTVVIQDVGALLRDVEASKSLEDENL